MNTVPTTKTFAATLEIRARGDTPEITITTPSRDLMKDTIDPMGMDLSEYLKGPPSVFFAHDYKKLPIGKTLALDRSPQGIRATFRWSESNPDVPPIRAAFEEGLLGASVGVIVPKDGTVPNKHGGRHYKKTTLTEWSLTGHPANRECVRLLKALGLFEEALTPEQAALAATITRAVVTGVEEALARWPPAIPAAPGPRHDSPGMIPLSQRQCLTLLLRARARQRALMCQDREDRLRVLPSNSPWILNDWL